MILVTGVTGTVGRAVLDELIIRGSPDLRVMVRSADDFENLPGGIDIVLGDFADPGSLTKALAGVDTAFLVCAPVPDLVQLETNFLIACQAVGVRHIVINSALGAEDFSKSFPSWHRRVEDKARELKLPVTILRPNGFMQNIATYFSATIIAQDAFYGTIGDAKISLIDVRDIAAAAAEAILTKNTVGHVYELSGPVPIDYETLAEKISEAAGRVIRYVNLTPDQMKQAMVSGGMPEPQATAVLELDDYYRSGKGAASDKALLQLLDGKPPRTLERYLAEVVGVFKKPESAG